MDAYVHAGWDVGVPSPYLSTIPHIAKFQQSLARGLQGRGVLREVKTDQMMDRLPEEARARDAKYCRLRQ